MFCSSSFHLRKGKARNSETATLMSNKVKSCWQLKFIPNPKVKNPFDSCCRAFNHRNGPISRTAADCHSTFKDPRKWKFCHYLLISVPMGRRVTFLHQCCSLLLNIALCVASLTSSSVHNAFDTPSHWRLNLKKAAGKTLLTLCH